MTTDDVERLNDLLHRMREEDPDFRVYGAGNHKYRLGPPLTEGELQAFEQRYLVTLPADFRFFLKKAGNGGATRSSAPFPHIGINAGAGPGGGVMPLEETVIGYDLSTPFPLTESVEVQPFPGIDRWGDEEDYPGLLEICYHGGADFSYLVVNGPAYGTVWTANMEAHIRNFHPTHSSFGSWYGAWMKKLEEFALPRLANERRVAGVNVGMTKAEVIALCGGEWKQKRFWEGETFLSFKHLSTGFKLNDEDVVVRIIAHRINV